jgi:hypothetical protein
MDEASNAPNYRQWISIALEESWVRDIEGHFLFIYPPDHVFWRVLECFLETTTEISTENITSERKSQVPLIGGYPCFLAALFGNLTEESQYQNIEMCKLLASLPKRSEREASNECPNR